MGKNALNTILEQFYVPVGDISIKPIKSGRINQTYLVTVIAESSQMGYCFILQSINSQVFKDPGLIMENMEALTKFHPLQGLDLIKTSSGKSWVVAADGTYYRLMRYVENSEPDLRDITSISEAGRAIGEFHRIYLSFPFHQLTPVINGFHHTPTRYVHFFSILDSAPLERISAAKEEVDFFAEHSSLAGLITAKLDDCSIPYHVTHNDTKIENILFDNNGKSICLIDFDTVMPGAIAWDFGDSIRSMTNLATEEETEIKRVQFSNDHFQSFAKGYASKMDGNITAAEVESLVPGCLVIALEQGLRFLTDYLNSDQYYPIEYEGQNLVRAQVQIAFLRQVLAQEEKLKTEITELFPISIGRGAQVKKTC